ncbi:MAG: hypothetical protein LBL46_02960 [Rickettsiales bacterium]|jgi:hypothetical protein|nr:hypothetical protein [Rickettsiales bacterium]
MKRFVAFAAIALLAGAAFASCPSGYVSVDVGDLYQVVPGDTCPSGYVAIDTSLKIPDGDSLCDSAKGTCTGSCTYTP